MQREYDFSKGERGKFYKPGAAFKLPVYLDESVQAWLAAHGQRLRPHEICPNPKAEK